MRIGEAKVVPRSEYVPRLPKKIKTTFRNESGSASMEGALMLSFLCFSALLSTKYILSAKTSKEKTKRAEEVMSSIASAITFPKLSLWTMIFSLEGDNLNAIEGRRKMKPIVIGPDLTSPIKIIPDDSLKDIQTTSYSTKIVRIKGKKLVKSISDLAK